MQMASSQVILECTCKVGRCVLCSACKRCGCDHDGVPVHIKMNRRRGRPVQGSIASTPNRHNRRRRRSSSSTPRPTSSVKQARSAISKTSSVRQLREAFGISQEDMPRLPDVSVRNSNQPQEWDSIERRRGAVQFVSQLLDTICCIVYPADPDVLRRNIANDAIRNLGYLDQESSSGIVHRIAGIYSALPVQSIQRQVLAAPVCRELSSFQAKTVRSS